MKPILRHPVRLAVAGGLFSILAVGVALWAFGAAEVEGDLDFPLIAQHPHDRQAYTQGLLYHDGQLYESTGLYGRSSLRRVELTTGRVLQRRDLPRQLFGEGLVLVGERLIQLTWRAGVAIVYDRESFEPQTAFRYPTQGWGLTFDGRHLVMSDGSARLYFRDPTTFAVVRTVTVTDDIERPVAALNELEYIDGEVWANIYRSFDIVRIDPATGKVVARHDFRPLLKAEDRYGGEDVLNGIAFDPATRRLFLTGKLYAFVYVLQLP
ncbi:MAG: glutaminyl-peptide cyclotransferase [Candidatus Competibacterales bacterium]